MLVFIVICIFMGLNFLVLVGMRMKLGANISILAILYYIFSIIMVIVLALSEQIYYISLAIVSSFLSIIMANVGKTKDSKIDNNEVEK